jgi:hypothetical protein
MKTLTLILIMMLATSILKAQHDTLGSSKYKCKIGLTDTKKELQGEIYKTDDTTITIKKSMYGEQGYNRTESALMPIPVKRIDYISIYKKGSAEKGLIIGGMAGAIIGGLIGYASGDDEPTPGQLELFLLTAGEKAGMGAVIGFIPGALIGLAAGSSKIIIGIHGNADRYKSRRKALDNYSIKN